MLFNKSIPRAAIDGTVNFSTPGVDGRHNQRIVNSCLPGQRLERRHTGSALAMSRNETFHRRQPDTQSCKRARTHRRSKKIDVLELQRQMLEKELDRSEQAFGMLNRRSKPDFAYIFVGIDNTNASALGTRVDRQNAHALL